MPLFPCAQRKASPQMGKGTFGEQWGEYVYTPASVAESLLSLPCKQWALGLRTYLDL